MLAVNILALPMQANPGILIFTRAKENTQQIELSSAHN